METWVPFVNDCLMLLDGDGSFRHWKYKGAYADQPYTDITIYQVIRGKWVELKNAEISRNMPKFKNRKKPSIKRRGVKGKKWSR